MKYLILLILMSVAPIAHTQDHPVAVEMNAELLEEFNDFMKETTSSSVASNTSKLPEIDSIVDVDLLSKETKLKPKTNKSLNSSKKSRPSLIKKSLAKNVAIKPKKNRVIDSTLKKEMNLLSKKIEDLEQEYENQTIEEKKEMLGRPIQYETYTRIKKIPLSEIRGTDDVLKHEDEIIEIKFTNLMEKEI